LNFQGYVKMALAAGFVAVGAVRSTGDSYSRWILVGLLLSAAGDAFLLSEARRAFLAGLLAFLLAHLSYAVAFAPVARPAFPVLVVIALATAAVLAWLWPRLGAMRAPVIGYALAIGLMLWLASGVDRPVVPAGALLFWLSDLLVARHRFGPTSPLDREVGWPLYFAGQYLLAFSIG
jgi:uncharacterized membrane protein YhhN